jgi:hypothetical protein
MTIIRRDNGTSTAMQYDRWQAAQNAPKQNRVERVAHHPAVFIGSVIALAVLIVAAVLEATLGLV